MTLSESDQKHFEEWLDLKKISNKCPFCKKGSFERKDWDIKFIPLVKHITDPHSQTIPYVSMTCSNCGHVVHFAADKIFPED